MVKFLLNKPIAVTMTFIAVLVLGIVATTKIPVSLMPDIAIPEITVQISDANSSARELENSVVRILRQQLLQVSHLDDINSETRDGISTIRLNFDYGTNVNYAFIEVNEKIDRAMNYLPRDLQRPKVIKASASDIPVFYLNLTLRNSQSGRLAGKKQNPNSKTVLSQKDVIARTKDEANSNNLAEYPASSIQHTASSLYPVSQEFVELSRFASNVICKRLEQLPEVAMVDMSGQAKTELLIMPDLNKLQALGITLGELENRIENNNIRLGNLSIKDGQYIYNVRFSSVLQNKHDLENIYLKTDNRLYQLKDIAEVIDHPRKLEGMVLSNGQQAITLAVIKQSDAQISQMKEGLEDLVNHFKQDYPDIDFEISRNQTLLLDYSLTNLKQSLLWGALLAFLVMFIFLRDFKSPLLIGVTIPLSLIVSLLFFHLIGLSINIISLSGLILGVGMMIDNSIIVIDNITQHIERSSNRFKFKVSGFKSPQNEGEPELKQSENRRSQTSNLKLLMNSCISGTNEVIRPMLSSVLTTCAVFVPLIFINGIAGALFYDQAMAITIGLFASLIVSITVLPVYYMLFYKRGNAFGKSKFLKRFDGINYENLYEKGLRFTLRKQHIVWLMVVAMLIGSIFIYQILPKTKLPALEKNELLYHIDWNEPLNIEANRERVLSLIDQVKPLCLQHTSLIGAQQFVLEEETGSSSEVTIYIKAKNPIALDSITNEFQQIIISTYPNAVLSTTDAGNIFNIVFSDDEVPLMARLRANDDFGNMYNRYLKKTHQELQESAKFELKPINWQEHTVLNVASEKLLLYNVSYNQLYGKLKSLFNENEIFLITDNNDFVPVVLGGKPKLINEIIESSSIQNSNGKQIPIRELIDQSKGYDLKTIIAGKEGEYYPIIIPLNDNSYKREMDEIRNVLKKDGHFEASFTGSIFSNRIMIKQLIVILLISLALLYFILASQFESLTLPLIVLMEVPIDLFGAFLFLWLFGSGLNLMSLIGIVVMSGIVINDSILKIDTINQLRNNGYSLLRAISEAGQRRLKPILMTSITTILALVPFLLITGLGSELQKPLALAVIGGMIFGTLISLYFIPLGYYYLKKHHSQK